ncbi:MAG: DUF2177 family protein [Acidobacteriota bacterium]
MALVTFGLLDGLWLGAIKGTFHKTRRSLLARMSGDRLAPLWGPALCVYVLLACAIVAFVIPRNYADASLIRGALVGLVVYGVYDLVTLSTLQAWPAVLTTVDIAWAAAASAITTWIVALAHGLLR